MLRNPVFAVVSASLYLALYCMLSVAGYGEIVTFMFVFSPVLVIWMVITVLKYGKYTSKELGQHDEWGYEDKNSERL